MVQINGGTIALPISSYPSAAAPADNVSLEAVTRELFNQQDKVVTSTAATIPNATTTYFTYAGGAIFISEIISNCITTNNSNATTVQWTVDATSGSATTITGVSASLASLVAGDMVITDFTLLTTVPLVMSTGISAVLGSPVTQRYIIANGSGGVVQLIGGTAASTGTWTHSMRYRPLGRGVTVTAT